MGGSSIASFFGIFRVDSDFGRNNVVGAGVRLTAFSQTT